MIAVLERTAGAAAMAAPVAVVETSGPSTVGSAAGTRHAFTVRPLRDDEARLYLEIVNSAISGLAGAQYPAAVINGWMVPVTGERIRDLMANPDREIRVVAELNGRPVGIGALVVDKSELRACYVSPDVVRQGCGSALVRDIERLAREQGLTRLQLSASLNAEAFYAALGYRVQGRGEITLHSGVRMAAVRMTKEL